MSGKSANLGAGKPPTDLSGLTTRNHGDLVDGIMVRQQGANDGMARFMVGNEFLRGIVLVSW